MSNNRFPDCVYIEIKVAIEKDGFSMLEAEETRGVLRVFGKALDFFKPRKVFKGFERLNSSFELKEKSYIKEQKPLTLYLTINFNEQLKSFPFPLGRIKFGIKNGELHFKLKGCTAPYEKRRFNSNLKPTISKQISTQSASGAKSAIGLSLLSSKETESSTGLNIESSQSREVLEKFEVTEYQISTKGNLPSPKWVFEEKVGEGRVLKGTLNSVGICELEITDLPIDIEATFLVNDVIRDIVITDGLDIYKSGNTKKKTAVIERGILRKFLEPELKPYLSQASLRYE